MEFTVSSYDNSQHALYLPDDLARQILEKMGKRVICQVNDQATFHCAIQKSRQGYCISFGKKTQSKVGAHPGMELQLRFLPDNSPYQAEVPEELMEVLETDPAAKSIFESLTDGKKRSIIHMVDSAKRMDTRINRSLKIMENLKLGIRDPRELLQ